MKLLFSILFIVISLSVSGQDLKRLKKDVKYLSSDKLEGRLTGSKGERKAATYIYKSFKKSGIKPLPEMPGYLQNFFFNTGYNYGSDNYFSINGHDLKLGKEYYPLVFSKASTGFSGKLTSSIILVDLSDVSSDPHAVDTSKTWRAKLNRLKSQQPTAVIFYNSPKDLSISAYSTSKNIDHEEIPLLHVTDSVANWMMSLNNPEIEFFIDLRKQMVSGFNVAGYIDNGKPTTVVIGAHYDHLGYNEFGGSMSNSNGFIHNGADDNASGTAVLMELARLLKNADAKGHNYMFVAFSGEEEGLLGSNYFTKNLPGGKDKIAYMINLDMVGRLDSTQRELGINGVGTSPTWDSVIKVIQSGKFSIKTTQSGMGNSDHTSFYLQNIPAIHFFTGIHRDYHKPSDDAHLINYAGMGDITAYIVDMVKLLDNNNKLVFTRTKDETGTTPRFTVTLGIMPDYFYDGKGVRADGISVDKPAEKAGLKAGDIIIMLGKNDVTNMQTYMEALSLFKKGDKTTVTVLRGTETITLPIEF